MKDVPVGREAGHCEFPGLGPSLGAEGLELWAGGIAAPLSRWELLGILSFKALMMKPYFLCACWKPIMVFK